MGVIKGGKIKPWTQADIDVLVKYHADISNDELAVMLGRSKHAIGQKACVLDLKKSREYILHKQHRSKAACFKKGHATANKGKRQPEYMSKEAIERCKPTQFKAGQKVWNEKKDLDITVRTASGKAYQYIRVAKAKWMLYNRWVWEQNTGEKLKRGDVIRAKDGNRLNVEFSNLEKVSTKENMARNTIQRYPDEVKTAIRLIGKVNKTIKKQNNE